MRIISFIILIVLQQLIAADDEHDEWKYPVGCTGYGCDYRAQWWYLEKTDEIKFLISSKFRGKWTGIGFSDEKQMKGTDAVLGLVEDNGRYFLMDTYLSGYQAPPLDAVQNIHNMSVWRENGITHLQFHRYRTTSDPEYDFQFTDDHCPYFLFPIRGGVFNAVNKRMRKHEETPIVSKNRICIRSKDPNKRKKVIEVPAPVRYPTAVSNKIKIPTRFKARPKLTQLLATTTTSTTSTTTSSPTSTSSSISSTSSTTTTDYSNKSPEPTINDLNLQSNRKPIDQPTTLPADLNKVIDNDRSIDKSIGQPTTRRPSTSVENLVTNASTSITPSIELSTATSVSSENRSPVETVTSRSIESKNEDKLEYGDDDDEISVESKKTSDDKSDYKTNDKIDNKLNDKSNEKSNNEKTDQDGRISTNQVSNEDVKGKNAIKSFNFDLKILNPPSSSSGELNSTLVHQEAENELRDLTGFKQLKLITLKPINEDSKPASWIVDFEMQVHTDSDTNDTDYLAYLQNAINETVSSGHIGNLNLDTSHYAQLKQDFNQTKQSEAKYIFEYNFFNQYTVKLTKEQLKYAYIGLGVSLLVLLVLMQACCMCCSSNESNIDLNKQNNLSNSSTLQDKHQLNMHHHAQYNDYIKNCGTNYSYENFGMDADVSNYDPSYQKMKHSISKHDPMLYNYPQHHQQHLNHHQNNSYNRRSEFNKPEFGYNNYHNSNFNNYHHNNHHSSSHHGSNHVRYFEPQPMQTLEPDFYFMPKQRLRSEQRHNHHR